MRIDASTQHISEAVCGNACLILCGANVFFKYYKEETSLSDQVKLHVLVQTQWYVLGDIQMSQRSLLYYYLHQSKLLQYLYLKYIQLLLVNPVGMKTFHTLLAITTRGVS